MAIQLNTLNKINKDETVNQVASYLNIGLSMTLGWK